MKTYKEIANDHGVPRKCYTSDNLNNEFVITSARGHDLVDAYQSKYSRRPHTQWYRRHFQFERVR